MMLLALDKDDGRVFAFADPAEVSSQCKEVDVRDGFWLFFDEDGSPLEARFVHPEIPGKPAPVSHDFTLQRAMSGRWLQERLDHVTSVEGCGLATVEDLAEALKINRSKRLLAQKRG